MSFSEDLARIRIAQNLTIQTVHEQIKVPLHVLKSIEDGSIFNDHQKNATYIRSFVRTYAKALKIKDDDVIKALDMHQDGTYSGLLADVYLDEHSRMISPTDEPIESGSGLKKADEGLEGTYGEHLRVEYSRPDPEAPHNVNTPPPPKINSINWAELGQKKTALPGVDYRMALIGFAVLALVIAVVYIVWLRPSSKPTAPVSSNPTTVLPERTEVQPVEIIPSMPIESTPRQVTPAPETSLTQTNASSPQTTPAAPFVPPTLQPIRSGLADTLVLVIYASKGNLEPVRIKPDLSSQWSPYWIEEGDAMRIKFINEVSFRGQYDRMSVMLNGHLVENFRDHRGPDREIVLKRSLFENEAKFKQVRPDSSVQGVEPPKRIYDRPTF